MATKKTPAGTSGFASTPHSWKQEDHWRAFRSVVERCGVRHFRVNNEYTGEWYSSFEDLPAR